MGRAQGARAQMALAFETVYGTPPAANNYWKIPFASTTLGSEQPLLESELLGFGRDPIAPTKDAITADGNVVVPIDTRLFGVWLKSLFVNPDTTGSGPYSHRYRSGGWNLPSMSIEVQNPDVPSFRMLSGVVSNSINWTMQRSGLVTATIECIAQGETPATSSIAGTLTEMGVQRFGAFNGAIKRGGAALGNVVSGQITYTNNLDRVETIRNDGKIEGADPSMAMLSGEIVVRFADTTLLDQAINGQAAELDFEYQIDANTRFNLVAHEVYLPRPRLPIQGPGGMQATFAWQAAKNAVETVMCTATLLNDTSTYDNPSAP